MVCGGRSQDILRNDSVFFLHTIEINGHKKIFGNQQIFSSCGEERKWNKLRMTWELVNDNNLDFWVNYPFKENYE